MFLLPFPIQIEKLFLPLISLTANQETKLASYLATTMASDLEYSFVFGGFRTFFEAWLDEHSRYLEDLVSMAQNPGEPQQVMNLVERVYEHYEIYYETKEKGVNDDVLAMLTPSWWSLLENAFKWIGGWRPTIAFHLLYSKSGLQFDESLDTLIQGFNHMSFC